MPCVWRNFMLDFCVLTSLFPQYLMKCCKKHIWTILCTAIANGNWTTNVKETSKKLCQSRTWAEKYTPNPKTCIFQNASFAVSHTSLALRFIYHWYESWNFGNYKCLHLGNISKKSFLRNFSFNCYIVLPLVWYNI